MTLPVLMLRDVEKRYDRFVFGPVSLAFTPGRVHGVLGPNGAGKTTLFNLLTLQTRVSSGSLWYGERRIAWGDGWWKARFAYVRETPLFYPELTVARTLNLAAQLYPNWDSGLAERLTDTLGLPAGARVSTLSKGTLVKLGIAAALAQRAEFLLLDEPTAGLDPDARQGFYDVVRHLRDSHPGLSIIIASHIFQDLEVLADDVIVLRDGRLARRVNREQLDGGDLEHFYNQTRASKRESA